MAAYKKHAPSGVQCDHSLMAENGNAGNGGEVKAPPLSFLCKNNDNAWQKEYDISSACFMTKYRR